MNLECLECSRILCLECFEYCGGNFFFCCCCCSVHMIWPKQGILRGDTIVFQKPLSLKRTSVVSKHCLNRQFRFRNRANVCERPHVVFMQKIQSMEKLYLVSLKYNISQAERNEPLKYSLTHQTEEFSRGVSLPERDREKHKQREGKLGAH